MMRRERDAGSGLILIIHGRMSCPSQHPTDLALRDITVDRDGRCTAVDVESEYAGQVPQLRRHDPDELTSDEGLYDHRDARHGSSLRRRLVEPPWRPSLSSPCP
jgi:hypothetical protein